MDIKKIGAGLILLIAIAVLSNIHLFKIMGSKDAFSAIEFVGPIAVIFLGPLTGVLAVLLGKGFSLGVLSFGIFDIGRILAMPLAALYFAYYKKYKWISLLPALGIILFALGPNGAISYWYYALYWLIPAIIAYADTNNLFLRSLGATFTAHAVGSVAFLYAFAPNPALWGALIPVVAVERLIFALGISASYVVIAYVLKALFPDKNISIFGNYKMPLLG